MMWMNRYQASGVALSVGGGRAVYLPFAAEAEKAEAFDLFSAAESKRPEGLSAAAVAAFLQPLLADPGLLKIGHDVKRDMHFLSRFLTGETAFSPYDDVEVISYVLDSTSHGHGLAELSNLFLGVEMTNPDKLFGVGRQKISAGDLEPEIAAAYACEQADVVFRLHEVLRPRLAQERMATVYEHYDRPLVATLFEMEKNGVAVNAAGLKELSAELENRQHELEKEIFALAGEEFNLGSPKQIGEILYGKLGLKGKKSAGGGYQTGAEVLEKMAEEHPLPAKILDWRAVAKLKSTYTDALLPLIDGNGRVHTTYSQTTVNTGRLSSVNPNLQNIPVRSEDGLKIRRCFVARPGCRLISADYSQVELRLMAVLADVKALKEAFAAGIDIHTATAMQVFGLLREEVTPNVRRHAKAINFGVIYGISQYNDKNQRIASFAERAAINAPLQGGAADIMKKAMNEVFARLKESGLKARILLQVHDEMVLEAPAEQAEETARLLKETMEGAVSYDVAFVADTGIGGNWAEAH